VLDLGQDPDPVTGITKRRQKWYSFRGSKKHAEDKLADLLKEAKDGTCIDPSKLTLADWLREWLAASKKQFRPNTYTRYQGIIEHDFAVADIGKMRLQKLRATHLEAYYNAATLAPSTLDIHQAILYPALAKAKRNGLVAHNVAADLDRPKAPNHKSDDARQHCWTALEAQAVLEAAQARGLQAAAFYALALDSGARKGELCGLTWDNLHLDDARMDVVQTLLKPGPAPIFGPPKTGRPRSISLSATTVARLRAHRQHQRELFLANRPRYADHRLVFAKEWFDLQRATDGLGQPLQINNLGQREYAQVVKVAGVRGIKFHGMRHTCATLLLQARVPVHVVSERLGHAKVSTTMEIYAHVLPHMQREAADTIGALLFKTAVS
jgi:integrase